MIKIIKVYKDSRILENGTLDTLGLAIKNDNNFDILRFKFDEFIDGVGSLLTTLEDDNNEKVAFPLTKNAEENSYDLVITREIASTNELEFQLLITYEDDVVWHSRIAKLQILNALDVGTGTMPTTIDNWLENANLVMNGYENQINQWGEEIEQAVTGAENVNIEVEEGENLYNVTITDRDGNEYQAVIYQGANAVISGATASVDQTIGIPNVVVTMGGTESDRTFDFAFHNLKGEKGDKGDKGDAGAIKMQIVDQLPPTGSDDTIYLVPITPDTSGNNYAEYVYINGAWELLGRIGVQVDLTDYVKNTDYATTNKGGIIKVSNVTGTNIASEGILQGSVRSYEQYINGGASLIISKGTLENVITGKQLVNQSTLNSSQATQDTKITTLEDYVFGDETIEAENTSMTLNNTLKGQFNSIDLKGNTSQTGTPTPSSPIPVNVVSGDNEINVCGNNLFNKDNIFVGYLKEDGTLSTDTAYRTSDFMPIRPNTTYYKTSTGSPRTKYFDINKVPLNTTTYWDVPTGGSAGTFTTPNNAYYLRFSFPFTGSSAIDASTIMVKEGTDTIYEPYQGDTYNIDLPVENLLDTQYFEQGSINTSGVDVSANTNARGSNYIPVQPNTSYTISANTQLYDLRLNEYKSDQTHVIRKNQTNTKTLTITTGSETYFVRWSFNYNNSTATTQEIIDSLNLQLEKGTKVNSYTPFGTTPIELCKIGNYQDYFYKEDDKWYLHKEIGKAVLNGAEAGWGKTGYTLTNDRIYTGKPLSLCSHFTNAGDNWSSSNESYRGKYSTTNTNDILKCMPLTDMTTTQFKDWLSTNNVSLYYALSTPTSTQITYQPLIDQLNLLEQAQSKENQTNISQVNNDLPFIISASAFLNNINGKIALLNKLMEV